MIDNLLFSRLDVRYFHIHYFNFPRNLQHQYSFFSFIGNGSLEKLVFLTQKVTALGFFFLLSLVCKQQHHRLMSLTTIQSLSYLLLFYNQVPNSVTFHSQVFQYVSQMKRSFFSYFLFFKIGMTWS